MKQSEVINMYAYFAHTQNETTFLSKHGKEIVKDTHFTILEFWLNLDAEFGDVEINEALNILK